jgi:hypothetical protein
MLGRYMCNKGGNWNKGMNNAGKSEQVKKRGVVPAW